MNHKPVEWRQFWLPLALQNSVPMYEGDGYLPSRSLSHAVANFYSPAAGGWIHFNNNADIKYTVSRPSWVDIKDARNGVGLKWTPMTMKMDQDELAAEVARLAKLGAHSTPIKGRRVFELIKTQRLSEAPAAVTPPWTPPVVYDEPMVKAIDVWHWYIALTHEFEFTDEEKKEQERVLAEIGVSPPTREVMATFQVGMDINDEVMMAKLKELGFTITDITS